MPRMLKAAEGLQIKGLSNVRSKREAVEDDDSEKSEMSSPSSMMLRETGDNNVPVSRRSSGVVSSEVNNERSNVPLHRRRKRIRTTSHETEVRTTIVSIKIIHLNLHFHKL